MLGSLVAAAVIYAVSLLALAVDPDDVGRLETPFVLSVARQLQEGPRVLYGPYQRGNHLVLIHAPLYYRLAASVGWLISRSGVEPVTASLIAGRSISLLAMLFCLAAAGSISRLDGGSARACRFTVLLIIAAPIPGILAVMVRPDMTAVAFQTWGVFWVLKTLTCREEAPRTIEIIFAYLAFGLAICAKQHNVVTPAVSSAMLIAVTLRRRGSFKPVVLAHLAGLSLVFLYFALEEVVTGGRMSQSAFVLPSGPFRTINLGSWTHVRETFAIIAKKMAGYLVLGACCGWFALSRRCGRLERWLMVYLVAEILALVPLYYYNLGAADNYALQGIVFGAILMGRCLARLIADPEGRAVGSIAVAIAALLIAARDVQFVELVWGSRAQNRADLLALRTHPPIRDRAADAIYFVDRPEYNRLFGNPRLAHDEFVYGAFEAVGAAEPKSEWLKSALASGTVQIVVMPEARTEIPGLRESLPDLGYRFAGRYGIYRVWERP
jgi:hypothetical protein